MALISWYTLIGLMAQLAFGSRMLVQWIMSEKARQVVSPALFWWLSLVGAGAMALYGYLRSDFAILFCQLTAFYVYLYNLKLKRELYRLTRVGTLLLLFAPPVLLAGAVGSLSSFEAVFFDESHIAYGWLIWGITGQFLFTFRYLYQMLVSRRRQESVLPPLFWYISLTAALLVQVYGIYRLDVVLILGQVGGMVTYVRNIMIGRRACRDCSTAAADTDAAPVAAEAAAQADTWPLQSSRAHEICKED